MYIGSVGRLLAHSNMSYMMLLFLLVGIIVLIVYFMPKKLRTKIMFLSVYHLYARTRVGLLFHMRQLRKYSKSVDEGKTQRLHSKVVEFDDVTVHVIPFLTDNLAYLIVDKLTMTGVLIDPADPHEVTKYLSQVAADVSLQFILCTHKHWDHAGGNGVLRSVFPSVNIYSSSIDSAYKHTHTVVNDEVLKCGQQSIRALFTPGHTTGHMTYILDGTDKHPSCLFTGDHLFIGGCGQIFEGGPVEMLQSLKRLLEADHSSLVFPGHDYALPNLQFTAHQVDPDNKSVKDKLKAVTSLASARELAVPAVLSEELSYNPFLRLHDPIIRAATGLGESASDEDILLELRRMKNRFSKFLVWF